MNFNHASPTVLLRARNLAYRHGAMAVLSDFSLELQRGSVLGLLGPNGAGKSTALQMLTGNLAPKEGSVEILGVDLATSPLEAKLHLGYLPDPPPLYRELSVTEYLALAARLHRVARPQEAVARVLQRCALEEVRHRLIGNLSKGFRQRLGIAQAVIHDPSLIVLDEPGSGLDPIQAAEMRDLIRELGKDRGIVMATHSLAEAETLCDQLIVLRAGATVFSGPTEELLQRQGSMENIFRQLVEAEAP